MQAQKSLKYLSEELIVCLQFAKMSSADSVNSNPTSIEKQLTTKCDMFGYYDKNINEAIQKLDEIKERGSDAVAKKSPFFSLVLGADEDLQAEAYNLHSRGLKYVFSVGEAPRFSWEGLLVVFLGVLQIVGGALLIAFTYGTFAQVGMGLIAEGISDCIYGIEAMVTGEFSWKEWAIEKAISIGVSVIGLGVGKLISKGFKCFKTLFKFGKQLKAMPTFLSRQAKNGLSAVLKTNLKNALKYTGKTFAEEIITYGLGKAEDEIVKKILEEIKNQVKKGTGHNVKLKIKKKPLSALIDLTILSQLEDKNQLHYLLKDGSRKKQLLAVFKELSKTAVQPFYADLSLHNKLNSSISQVIQKAKAHTKGKAFAILATIQALQIGTLAGDAIESGLTLSDKFFSNFHEQLKIFKETQKHSENINVSDLSDGDIELLKEFKQDLADTISALLADALVEVFHQKFSSHIVSVVKGQVNGVIGGWVRKGLKSDRTEEKLRAGQNNSYITYMPRNLKSKHKVEGEAGQRSQTHSEKIKNSTTAGTILDIRVLSEATGTKVVILTEDRNGRLTKMQELSPDTGPTNKTVRLIYRPKSAQYPGGHYDVLINDQIVNIESEGKSCLFHALARGMNPAASEEEIALEENRLRSVEADALLRHPDQWEPFIKRKELTEAIRGGDWYMLEGAAAKTIKENKKSIQKFVGKQQSYRDAKNLSRRKANKGIGQFMNADHQPPVSSILNAREQNQNSILAKAMVEVATKSSTVDISNVHKYHDLELPTVYVPKEIHHEFSSTKSPAFSSHLANTISKDDVVGTFKLTILGSMPRFWLKSSKKFENFQNTQMSKTRHDIFKESFQKHSTEMVKTWFSLLQSKGVMTDDHLTTINDWINKQGYNNQNDPHRNDVINLLL
ncbi:uncharacterized protein LOC115795290 [Archocentrus centrarchus]|uniref:uncharacterized protein LOC115795290 n=1 Tax=Archocentrus centrarchus TaxID=63155 RepID=UPI0011E9CADD|nr:uncharacterized protein LOC115795290 [Archocentrus centrarchus]